ncbi:MAG: transglutaminase family protein [Thermodesulfobacteriota bacterium]
MKTAPFLESTDIIDWNTTPVLELAHRLSRGLERPNEIGRACFEWVRDEIGHSGDIQSEIVTCSASEVLREKTGWCFAKSHLLAALLRANSIPAGLCYQRLASDDSTGFTLHGLNALFLPETGWYRVDPRGNKTGVDARFTPPVERLAWTISAPGEMDLPEIWPEPLPIIVDYLHQNDSLTDAVKNLPDIELIPGCQPA